MSKKILVATTNPGKIAELTAMLNLDVEWVSLSEFSDIAEIQEDGLTFAENARKKALGYAKATGLWTIAEDSGLVVDALGGEPGVKSARFSGEKLKGEDRTLIDHRNIAKVLEMMKDVPEASRTARFVCHICLADSEKVLAEAQGRFEGYIARRQKGSNGFGYDPVFYVAALEKTVAELSPGQKNAISHRADAVSKLMPKLTSLLGRD